MGRLFSDAYASVGDPWLRRALELAERGRGTTSPNPLVGCVLVRDGAVVAEAFHEVAGGPHAEAAALALAGTAASGSTAYVTLEPCTHQGRTPPCVPALIEAGVERVVIGMRDPNASVSGGGAEALRAAGVQVEFAEDATPFEGLNREWIRFTATGLPFVRVKVALTLDGHSCLDSGVRSDLTGAQARALTMRLRAGSDAVMVGASTVQVDDPSLTVRGEDGSLAPRQPVRVVLARTEQPAATARVFGDGFGRVIVLVPNDISSTTAVTGQAPVMSYPAGDGLRGALLELARLDVVALLVEAGPRLFSALWDEDRIDELVLYHAGGMAGPGAPPLFLGPPQEDPTSLERRMRAVEAGIVGDDAVTVWRRAAEAAGTGKPYAA